MLPLGLRNANPGNLRVGPIAWQGQIGENKGFVVFDTLRNGLRALARLLLIYQDRYGINTVRKTIERWAPSSENDTEAYIAAACAVLECKPDDRFNFSDANFLFWMITAIGSHENGAKAFAENVSDFEIEAAIAEAMA